MLLKSVVRFSETDCNHIELGLAGFLHLVAKGLLFLLWIVL